MFDDVEEKMPFSRLDPRLRTQYVTAPYGFSLLWLNPFETRRYDWFVGGMNSKLRNYISISHKCESLTVIEFLLGLIHPDPRSKNLPNGFVSDVSK